MRISTTDFTDFLESRIICKIDQYVGMNNSWQEQQVRQLSEHDQVPSFSTKLAQSCLVRISGHRGLKWRPIDWSWRSWSVDELSTWIYERSSDACELCIAFKASEFIVALGSYFNDRTLAIQTHRVTFVFFFAAPVSDANWPDSLSAKSYLRDAERFPVLVVR